MLYGARRRERRAEAQHNMGCGKQKEPTHSLSGISGGLHKNRAAGKPVDYMSLTMPAETRNYVPKLQALKNIIAQPQLFGVDLTPIPNRPYFKTVKNPA